MKVYVDENDIKRNIITYCNGTNTQQGLYVYGKDKIEVLSLSAHDKQVRKEEKIKINRLVRNWLIKEGFTAYKFDELFEEIRGTENE